MARGGEVNMMSYFCRLSDSRRVNVCCMETTGVVGGGFRVSFVVAGVLFLLRFELGVIFSRDGWS